MVHRVQSCTSSLVLVHHPSVSKCHVLEKDLEIFGRGRPWLYPILPLKFMKTSLTHRAYIVNCISSHLLSSIRLINSPISYKIKDKSVESWDGIMGAWLFPCLRNRGIPYSSYFNYLFAFLAIHWSIIDYISLISHFSFLWHDGSIVLCPQNSSPVLITRVYGPG